MPEVPGQVVVTAAPAGAAPVGWVAGVPVETSDLDAYLVELARSPQGTRLGLDARGGAAPGADDHRERAVRTWSARTLLTDRLLESEARRLGVGRPASPDNWLECLEAAGELKVLRPSEAEAHACYQANRYRYRLSEARLVRHVLVADETSAYRLRATLAGPAALAEVAEAVSTDEGTRARGGSLGWVERGQLAGALEQAIFDAAPGEICGPVESCFGWHLLVVEAVRAARTRSFAECRNEIMSELEGDRRRTAWREWWDRRVAESITVPAGAEQILAPGLPGTSHRH
jgi:PPIC-type PPIASE domain